MSSRYNKFSNLSYDYSYNKYTRKAILLLNDFVMKFYSFRLIRHFWNEKFKVKKKKEKKDYQNLKKNRTCLEN